MGLNSTGNLLLYFNWLKRINGRIMPTNPFDLALIRALNDLDFVRFTIRFKEDLLFRLQVLGEYHLIRQLFGGQLDDDKLMALLYAIKDEYDKAIDRRLFSDELKESTKKYVDTHQTNGLNDHSFIWQQLDNDLKAMLDRRALHQHHYLNHEQQVYQHQKSYIKTAEKLYADKRYVDNLAKLSLFIFQDRPSEKPANLTNFFINSPLELERGLSDSSNEEASKESLRYLYHVFKDNEQFTRQVAEKSHSLDDGSIDFVSLGKDREEIRLRNETAINLLERFTAVPEALQSNTHKLVQPLLKTQLSLEKERRSELTLLDAKDRAMDSANEANLVSAMAKTIDDDLDKIAHCLESISQSGVTDTLLQPINFYKQEIGKILPIQHTNLDQFLGSVKEHIKALGSIINTLETTPDKDQVDKKQVNLLQTGLTNLSEVERNLSNLFSMNNNLKIPSLDKSIFEDSLVKESIKANVTSGLGLFSKEPVLGQDGDSDSLGVYSAKSNDFVTSSMDVAIPNPMMQSGADLEVFSQMTVDYVPKQKSEQAMQTARIMKVELFKTINEDDETFDNKFNDVLSKLNQCTRLALKKITDSLVYDEANNILQLVENIQSSNKNESLFGNLVLLEEKLNNFNQGTNESKLLTKASNSLNELIQSMQQTNIVSFRP